MLGTERNRQSQIIEIGQEFTVSPTFLDIYGEKFYSPQPLRVENLGRGVFHLYKEKDFLDLIDVTIPFGPLNVVYLADDNQDLRMDSRTIPLSINFEFEEVEQAKIGKYYCKMTYNNRGFLSLPQYDESEFQQPFNNVALLSFTRWYEKGKDESAFMLVSPEDLTKIESASFVFDQKPSSF